MKIKFNSNEELPLNKTIEIPSMIVNVRAIFHLIKCKAKQKRLLPFYVTNNVLQIFFINGTL